MPQSGSDSVAVSVIIPAYFSEQTIRLVVDGAVAVLEREGVEFEIIIVDDGSGDATWSRIQELHRSWPHRVLPIQLARNFGQHNAVMCGFQHARGQYIVTMDDDMQHDPADIPRLLNALTQNAHHLVYGRYDRKQHKVWRNAASKLVNWLYCQVYRTPVAVTSLRALRRDLALEIVSCRHSRPNIDGLLAHRTNRIGAVPVAHHPRTIGRSGYTLGKLVKLALSLFAGLDWAPLRALLYAGLTLSSAGLLLLLLHLVPPVMESIGMNGSPFLIAGLLLGGAQLSSLGVIGRYLRPQLAGESNSPPFIVRHTGVLAESPVAARLGEDFPPRSSRRRRRHAA